MPVKSKNKPLKKKRNKLKSIRRKKRGGMIVNSPPSSPSSLQEISENEDMNLTNLSAALMLTPLFSYVRLLLFIIIIIYVPKKRISTI